MFIDRVEIEVQAGRGGDGVVSFRREKYVPKGGPDGGDGGRGGSVIIRVDPQLSTLLDLRYRNVVRAGNGRHGQGKKMTGRSGADEVIRVPAGTVVHEIGSGRIIADLTGEEQELVVARGGRGGKGNARFATPTLRAPRKAIPGEAGETKRLRLELKLIADVGLVGLPNAGKSTLLSVISAARPEIAAYPFTTLTPHLGIVRAGAYETFVAADIPGLIEGASQGRGLGHQFLRHVERTRVLAILIESIDDTPADTMQTLLRELERYNPALLARPRLIVRTKNDLGGERWDGEDLRISAATGENVDRLVGIMYETVRDSPAPPLERHSGGSAGEPGAEDAGANEADWAWAFDEDGDE
ncbi:MAG: GTPase Obg [Calditrichaeota bacterium]|nr:GTPase Obg [Calditrichota bacterium]